MIAFQQLIGPIRSSEANEELSELPMTEERAVVQDQAPTDGAATNNLSPEPALLPGEYALGLIRIDNLEYLDPSKDVSAAALDQLLQSQLPTGTFRCITEAKIRAEGKITLFGTEIHISKLVNAMRSHGCLSKFQMWGYDPKPVKDACTDLGAIGPALVNGKLRLQTLWTKYVAPFLTPGEMQRSDLAQAMAETTFAALRARTQRVKIGPARQAAMAAAQLAYDNAPSGDEAVPAAIPANCDQLSLPSEVVGEGRDDGVQQNVEDFAALASIAAVPLNAETIPIADGNTTCSSTPTVAEVHGEALLISNSMANSAAHPVGPSSTTMPSDLSTVPPQLPNVADDVRVIGEPATGVIVREAIAEALLQGRALTTFAAAPHGELPSNSGVPDEAYRISGVSRPPDISQDISTVIANAMEFSGVGQLEQGEQPRPQNSTTPHVGTPLLPTISLFARSDCPSRTPFVSPTAAPAVSALRQLRNGRRRHVRSGGVLGDPIVTTSAEDTLCEAPNMVADADLGEHRGRRQTRRPARLEEYDEMPRKKLASRSRN
mmetsp:Transcript_8546/g.25583  ORF Transcript_8546/g.25583 Transcript_8546/m.25583 type:complete len:547 (-) Transcript_8546:361-2001(-)